MRPLRYGLIGAGMMGQEHIRNIALLDNVEVVAVADPDETMRHEAASLAGPGCDAHATGGRLLEQATLDAIIVAAPNHTHHAILETLRNSDLPILCEKPLGISVAECNDIAGWFAGRPVWVAMEYRYMPPVEALRAALGEAGPLHMLTIREHRYPFLDKVGDWNRFNAQTGGTLVEKCCHHFDLMRLILGAEPVRVYASGGVDVNHLDERYGGAVPDILDNAYVIVDFDSGARAMLELCMFAEGAYWQEVISAVGAHARIEARIPGPARFSASGAERHAELAIARRASKVEETRVIETDAAILGAGDHHGSTFYQHQKFAAMVRDGGQPEVSLADGALAVAVGAAAEESARTGRPVTLS